MLGVQPARLGRLLYALAGAGFLIFAEKRFGNTPLTDHFLVRGKQTYVGGVHELWVDLWTATLKTAESVRSGRAAALHDFSHMSGDELRSMFRGLHGGAVTAGRALAEPLGFVRHAHLLDVGGGSGGLAIGCCRAVPDLRATVIDLPAVSAIAREFIAEEGMADRIDVIAADLTVETVQGSYDTAVLRHLLQTLSADAARKLIVNLSPAIEPGGRIHIIGWILEDSRMVPTEALNFEIVFLNIYEHGSCYAASEYKDWLQAAGFDEISCQAAPSGTAPPGCMMISARKG